MYISRHVLFNENHFPFSGHQENRPSLAAKTPVLVTGRLSLLVSSTLNHRATSVPHTDVVTISPLNHNISSDHELPFFIQLDVDNAAASIPPMPQAPTQNLVQSTTDGTNAVQATGSQNHSNINCPATTIVPQSAHVPCTNCHDITTRAKSGIFKPKIYLAHALPTSAAKALRDENWKKAMIEKYHALQKKQNVDPCPTSIQQKSNWM